MAHSRPDIPVGLNKKVPVKQASHSLILRAQKSNNINKGIMNIKSLHDNWTSWSKILRDNPILTQISTFYGSGIFNDVFTKPAAVHYSESDEFSPALHINLSSKTVNAYPTFTHMFYVSPLILLYMITKIIVRWKLKWWHSPLCSYLHLHVTLS